MNLKKLYETEGAHIAETPQVDRKTKLKVKQIKSIVKRYYEWIKEERGLEPFYIDYSNFELGDDNLTLFLKVGDKTVQITSKGVGEFINLETLARKINEIDAGVSGTKSIRNLLNLSDYKRLDKKLSAKAAAALRKVEKNLPNIDEIEMTDLPNTAETLVEEIETSFIYSGEDETGKKIYMAKGGRDETGTQTDIKKSEMAGVLEAMTSVREELTNNLAKLSVIDEHIARENTKLEEAKANNDEFQIERISDRIRDLESERSARLEVINTNRDKLRSQVNRIKETIHKILKEDTTLGERIKTLFREQGITIVSVLTAFGMIIGVIVEAFIPTTGGTTLPPKPIWYYGCERLDKKTIV